jgi:RHS repeat-associated protein
MIEDGATAYITGPDGLPIEQLTAAGQIRYYHHDQQGSTTALTDPTGTTVATYTYSPYGVQTTTSGGAVTNPFGYDGQYTDQTTGLVNLRARMYDPQTGQFLTRDALQAATRQPYTYAGDDPINYSDRSGLSIASFVSHNWRAVTGVAIDVVTITGCAVPGPDAFCGIYIAANGAAQSALVVTNPDLSTSQKAAGVGLNLVLAGGASLSLRTTQMFETVPKWIQPPSWIKTGLAGSGTGLGLGLDGAILSGALC